MPSRGFCCIVMKASYRTHNCSSSSTANRKIPYLTIFPLNISWVERLKSSGPHTCSTPDLKSSLPSAQHRNLSADLPRHHDAVKRYSNSRFGLGYRRTSCPEVRGNIMFTSLLRGDVSGGFGCLWFGCYLFGRRSISDRLSSMVDLGELFQ